MTKYTISPRPISGPPHHPDQASPLSWESHADYHPASLDRLHVLPPLQTGIFSQSYHAGHSHPALSSLPSTSSPVPVSSVPQATPPHLYGAPADTRSLAGYANLDSFSQQSLVRRVLPSAVRSGNVAHSLDHAQRGAVVPFKDTSGKYMCAQCSKTYLHLKHLKRHHLRHTGERPYQCYLCSETFCRSDILKRHFQKCSIRRGNPTGANHLTHAQAHLKGNSSAGRKGSSTSPNIGQQMQSNSNDSSRSSSVIRPASSSSEERRYNVARGMHGLRSSSHDTPQFPMEHSESEAFGGQARFASNNNQNYLCDPSYFGHPQGHAQSQGTNYGRESSNYGAFQHNAANGAAQPSWNVSSIFSTQSSDNAMQSFGT